MVKIVLLPYGSTEYFDLFPAQGFRCQECFGKRDVFLSSLDSWPRRPILKQFIFGSVITINSKR